MTLDEIKANPELDKKLKSIYTTLNSVMKDDAGHNKFSYKENEIPITLDVNAVNQHIAENRMKKINALMSLSDNWEAFNTAYKNDNILNKIGVEFINGKFEFDDKTLKTIKEYPHRKEVLYYFKKGVDVDMGNVQGSDYLRIKEQIFPTLEKNARIHFNQTIDLAKALTVIAADKSQKNLEYIAGLTEGTNPNSTITAEYGTLMPKVMQLVLEGNFTSQQKGNNIIIELPIPGVKKENGIETKLQSTLLTVNLENPKEYSLQVGSLEAPKMSFEDRLQSIRANAFGKNELKPKTLQPV